jgi:hypothetical protein
MYMMITRPLVLLITDTCSNLKRTTLPETFCHTITRFIINKVASFSEFTTTTSFHIQRFLLVNVLHHAFAGYMR